MKIDIKIPVTLTKSKEFPACYEYTLNSKTFVVTPEQLLNKYFPYDTTREEQTELDDLKASGLY